MRCYTAGEWLLLTPHQSCSDGKQLSRDKLFLDLFLDQYCFIRWASFAQQYTEPWCSKDVSTAPPNQEDVKGHQPSGYCLSSNALSALVCGCTCKPMLASMTWDYRRVSAAAAAVSQTSDWAVGVKLPAAPSSTVLTSHRTHTPPQARSRMKVNDNIKIRAHKQSVSSRPTGTQSHCVAWDTVHTGGMKVRDHPYTFTSSCRETRHRPSLPSPYLPPVHSLLTPRPSSLTPSLFPLSLPLSRVVWPAWRRLSCKSLPQLMQKGKHFISFQRFSSSL